MIELSNIRKEEHGDWVRLVCDVTGLEDVQTPLSKTNKSSKKEHKLVHFDENTIWFAVKKEDSDFLTDEVYDPFVLVPYYLAMYFGLDLHIHGKISKRLYFNLTNYAYKIFLNFSDYTRKINFSVDGFASPLKKGNLIGTGITCGVDSLTTLYSHFEKETDPEYRINHLFFFNCGTHGDYENPATRQKWLDRFESNRHAAEDLNLPISLLESNIHAFSHKAGGEEPIGYLSIYSCIFSVQSAVRLYYTSSDYEYAQVLEMGHTKRDIDISEYAGPYLVPLVRTENCEIIVDGSQYYRSEKTTLISGWSLAHKHLNVCVNSSIVGAKKLLMLCW